MLPAVDVVWGLLGVTALGWVWGSFLNQAVDRTPPLDPLTPRPHVPHPRELGSGAAPPWPTLLHPPRSCCFHCGRAIPWYENLPIVSYLLLRGRCRQCATPIGLRTLVLEVLTPLAFAALYAWQPSPALLHGPWPYLLLSWVLVAGPLWLERRRFSPPFLLLGAGLLGAAVGAGLLV